MHPVIFTVWKFPVHAYGLMLALSFLLGIWVASLRCKRRGLDPDVISDVGFYIILAAIVGARVYYIFLHFDEFSNDLGAMFNPFHGDTLGIGGLVMFGGYLGAIVAGFLFFKINRTPFLPYADASAPAIGLGIFLTRIGCFLNGCCYGSACSHAFCVDFPPISPAGYYQKQIGAGGLHPSQLYLSFGGLVIALVVIMVGRIRKKPAGLEFFLVGLLYSILRFVVDFTRYYGADERLGPLSHNQVLCIALFVVFLGLIVKPLLFADHAPVPPPVPGESAGDVPPDAR